jgi:hypothetical protein
VTLSFVPAMVAIKLTISECEREALVDDGLVRCLVGLLGVRWASL